MVKNIRVSLDDNIGEDIFKHILKHAINHAYEREMRLLDFEHTARWSTFIGLWNWLNWFGCVHAS